MQCGIKKRGMKIYYDNNGDGVQKVVATKPDDQALGEWKLHTLEDINWHDNHQHPIIYWSRHIIKSIRWLMRQSAYVEHLIYAPQNCVNSDTPLKRRYIEMHNADWWWETQVRRYSEG
jgi:hypothetical protein